MPEAFTKHLLTGILTILGVATLVFLALRVAPGDPAQELLGDWGDLASQEQIDRIRERLGVDKPLWNQYLRFLQSTITGRLGTSFRTGEPVWEMIASRFPPTLQLAIAGFVVAVVLGLTAGVLSAIYANRLIDRVTMVLSLLGLAAPNFWLGLFLLFLFGFQFRWFPLFGAQREVSTLATLHALILPAIALGTHSGALIARVTRSAMLEVLGELYVTTARSKGLIERVVILKHALRNAALPIATLLGLNIAATLGGSVVVEVVFARPGIGRLLVEAIFARDFPVVEGTVLVFAIFVVLANFLTDTLYLVLDPRVRLS